MRHMSHIVWMYLVLCLKSASKVPQNEAHEAHSLNVPQFEAHNLPVLCSSIPFLYYRHLTRPPSFPTLLYLYLILNSAHPSYTPLLLYLNPLVYVIHYWKYGTVSKGSYTPGAAWSCASKSFMFFLFISICLFITRFHIIRFSMHSCPYVILLRCGSGEGAAQTALAIPTGHLLAEFVPHPWDVHCLTLSNSSLQFSKIWSITAEKSWKGFPLTERNRALVSAVPTAA